MLHLCCAPCSTYVIELLKGDFEVTGYFYDPNIHPEEEYLRRLREMEIYAARVGLPLFAAEYDCELWFQLTQGWEWAPEGGERCSICYRLRLRRTASFAAQGGFDYLATVLSISPRKAAARINQIGLELAREHGLTFYAADFKKRDGFKKSVELSKKYDLYRQDYCGCLYSLRDRRRVQALRELNGEHKEDKGLRGLR